MIRPAVLADVPSLVRIGSEFLTYHPMRLAGHPEALAATLERLINSQQCVLVAEVDEAVHGAVVGMIGPVWFNPGQLVALELAWWVDDVLRGSAEGIRLLRAFEAWARKAGVDTVVLSDLVIDGKPILGDLTERLGYTLTERSHIKEL